jgi:hypothetical protein
MTWCTGDPTLPEEYWCLDGGVCVPDVDACASDADCGDPAMCACIAVDCPTGERCLSSYCVCE